MKKLMLLSFIVSSLFISGCSCALTTEDTSSEDASSSIPSLPKSNVVVSFYLDFNAYAVNEVYATQVVRNGEKLTEPKKPVTAPMSLYPTFKGWSTKEVVDNTEDDIWDFKTDTVSSNDGAFTLFGIWVE